MAHMSDRARAVQFTVHTGVFPLITCVFMYASAACAHGFKHISDAAQNKLKKVNKKVKLCLKVLFI